MPPPVTLFEVVQRAVDVCDPDGANDGAIDLLRRFEDADEPVTAIGDVEQVLAEVAVDGPGDAGRASGAGPARGDARRRTA